MARIVRKAVTMRTAARRARKREETQVATVTASRLQVPPETLGQARVWTRKQRRYELAGLCASCAAQAAWGHADGFQKIKDPCDRCQPLVSAFPHDGPAKSKWRKILDKLEYLDAESLGTWLEKWSPDITVSAQCGHPWCPDTGYGWKKVA